jgi:hypothetical protein
LALLTFALLLSVTISGAQQPDSSLATRRAQHLRHGINFSEWFAQVYDPKGYTKEHFNTWNHVFTHQGATWGENYWHFVTALPYPPDNPEAVAQAAAAVPDPVKRLAIIRYGADHWNAQRIDVEFDQVAAWAKRWNVPVVCNEFGVYRKVASPHDRANWLSDVRTSLEKHGIGWTMWDYSGGFGIVTKENGQPQPDEITVKALGRTMPPH